MPVRLGPPKCLGHDCAYPSNVKNAALFTAAAGRRPLDRIAVVENRDTLK